MMQSGEKSNRRVRLVRFVVLLLAGMAVLSAAAYAWLSAHQRAVGAVAEIDAPMAIWIRAGGNPAEDAKYLDMSDINVAGASRETYYVFAVAGEYVSQYKIQLAYTTNNQFSYEIYQAETTTEQDEALYTYYPHTSGNSNPIYYVKANETKINMTPLNAKSGNMLADPTDTDSVDTYGAYATETTLGDHVHENAWPLYWQTDNPIPTGGGSFCHYYLLHVSWGERTNDRETDMVYISAKVVG